MDAPLARRAFLGIRLPPGDGAITPAGVRVAGVVPGSMGAEAGLVPGDVVTRLGEHALRSAETLAAAVRAAGQARQVELEVERAGEHLVQQVTVRPWPTETIEGHEVRYGCVEAAGARLRTIETCPRAEGEERHPAVLFLQGIGASSVDFGATPAAPWCRLVHGWARAGFATMRVDKRGVGDSEGDVNADFEEELEGARAALGALVTRPFVDASRIFVFGHSVGGMAAPLLARSAPGPLRGVIVHGTSAMPWLACLERSARRQLALHGLGGERLEQRLAAREYLAVRSERFHAQLERADVAAAWRALACDVLVLCGEHDWVADRDDAQGVCDLVGGDRASLVILTGVDHWLTRHESLTASLASPGTGALDDQALAATVAWMRERLAV